MAIELTRLEFDVVWEHLGLGAFPTVYRMLGHGRTEAERVQLVQQAWDSMQAKGVGRASSVDPLLTELLMVLARPEREADARMNHGERAVRALAGARGDRAAVGVLDGGVFRFFEITPGSLSRAVVSLLPDHPAGRGASVRLPSAVFAAACKDAGNTPAGLRGALAARGMRADDAAFIADALDQITGAGQFGAARLDRWGKRHRAGHVVGFVDSAAGRVLLESRPAAGGEPWTTIAPTDPVRLTGQLDRLLADLDRQLDG